MKVKLKLDAQQLKQAAIAHVEKVVFGVLALVALMMMLKSFGLEKFPKTPSDFTAATNNAKQRLDTEEGAARALVQKTLKPKEYLAIANKNTEKFLADGYAWANVKPQVFPSGGLRKEPQYVQVEDLRAVASRAVFNAQALMSVADVVPPAGDDAAADAPPAKEPRATTSKPMGGGKPMGGSKPMGGGKPMGGSMVKSGAKPMGGSSRRSPSLINSAGLSFVVVTGRIPYAKQLKAFKEAVGTAEYRLPTDNTPEYLSPLVERAEVLPGAVEKDLKWVKVSGTKAPSTATKDRLSKMPDPFLDPQYLSDALTEPVYTLALGEWDPETIVPEEFRLKELPADAAAATAPVEEAPPAEGDDAIRPDDLGTGPGSVSGGPGVQQLGGNRPMGGGARPMGGGGRPMGGGGRPMGGRPMGGGNAMGGARPAGVANANEPTVDKYLFRFFDFSAEPGKRYRYRVRLFLKNPNEGVEARYLEDAKLAQQSFRYTEPSAPTEPASVPNDGTLIAGTYKPPAGPVEAAANVVLTQFIEQGGRTAIKELPQLFRGQLANISTKAAEAMIIEDETGELQPSDESVKFQNNLMLLDVSPADRNKPADVLIMNAEGKLVVLSGEAEKDRYADLTKKIAKVKLDQLKASKEEKDKERDKERAARRPAEDKDKKDKDKEDPNQNGGFTDAAGF